MLLIGVLFSRMDLSFSPPGLTFLMLEDLYFFFPVLRNPFIVNSQSPKRIFEGSALLRRLVRLGILDESQQKLDFILSLSVEKFLERRLQTRVLATGYASSIHHARVLIKHRHIRVGKRLVNVPSFMVRVDSDKHIGFASPSPFGQGRPGRRARKSQQE